MGCWNGTCGLTQLPINCGNKVIVFPLKQTSYEDLSSVGGALYYSNDIFTPISIPVIGEYNDYGALENIEDGEKVYEYFVSLIDDGKLTMDLKETARPSNIEELITAIKRGAIKGISFMMVHYEAYIRVMEEAYDRVYYGENFGFKTKWMELGRKYIEDVRQADNDLLIRIELMGNRFASAVRGIRRPEMRWFLDKLVEAHDEKLLESLVDLIAFEMVMGFSRKLWIPQAGGGSQCEERTYHKVLAEFVIEHEAAVLKQRDGLGDTREAMFNF